MLDLVLDAAQVQIAEFERFAGEVPPDKFLNKIDIVQPLVPQAELGHVVLRVAHVNLMSAAASATSYNRGPSGLLHDLLGQVFQDLFLDQYVLTALLSDILDDLRTDLVIAIQEQLLDRHVLLRVLEQDLAIVFGQAVLGQVEHAQVPAPAEKHVVHLVPAYSVLSTVERANLAGFALDCSEQFAELVVADLVGGEVEVLERLVLLDSLRKLGQICVAQAVVLHGQFFQILVKFEHVNDELHRFTGNLVPANVQELQLSVLHAVEVRLAHGICHFAVIEAQDLHLWVLVDHFNDAFVHLRLELVVAEVEGEEALEHADGVDDVGRLVVEDFELLHLQVLDATVRVAEQILKDFDLFGAHQHAIDS